MYNNCMLTEIEEAKKEQAARVMLLSTEIGMTVAEACLQVGITKDQYYRWVRRAPEVIDALRQVTRGLYAEEYARILAARATILEKVLDDGVSPMTDPLSRLTILQHIEQRGDDLQERLTPIDSEGLNKVLGMPVLKKGESRIVGGVQLDIQELEGGGINITAHPPIVIDGELDEV